MLFLTLHQFCYPVSSIQHAFYFFCSLVQPCWNRICCNNVFYQCYLPFKTSFQRVILRRTVQCTAVIFNTSLERIAAYLSSKLCDMSSMSEPVMLNDLVHSLAVKGRSSSPILSKGTLSLHRWYPISVLYCACFYYNWTQNNNF